MTSAPSSPAVPRVRRGPTTQQVPAAVAKPTRSPQPVAVSSHAETSQAATVPVGDAERIRALEVEIEQLRTAMASRAAIEQAKGILMLLTGCGEQGAFELLAHISSHTHRKVREVALAITASASGNGRLPADVQAILRDACPPAPH